MHQSHDDILRYGGFVYDAVEQSLCLLTHYAVVNAELSVLLRAEGAFDYFPYRWGLIAELSA